MGDGDDVFACKRGERRTVGTVVALGEVWCVCGCVDTRVGATDVQSVKLHTRIYRRKHRRETLRDDIHLSQHHSLLQF